MITTLKKKTIVPSVYGESKLDVDEEIVIAGENEFNLKLVTEINRRKQDKRSDYSTERAVLVFFPSKSKLDSFFNSETFQTSKLFTSYNNVLTMTEDTEPEDRDSNRIKACAPGMLTLAVREFGRGTDFMTLDENLNNAGGTHVIQTFISEDISEEIQIKGRTARQGSAGSFSFVIEKQPLEKYGIDVSGTDNDEIDGINKIPSKERYQRIRKKVNTYFSESFPEKIKYLEVVKSEHVKGMNFLQK